MQRQPTNEHRIWRSTAAFAASALLTFRSVWGLQDAAPQPIDVSELKQRLNDPNLTGAQRSAALLEVLAARRKLIQSNSNVPQRAIWMTDQASDLYFERLSQEGLGLTVLFGAATSEQRQRAAEAAAEMHAMASQAEAAINQTILQIESAPNFQTDPALQQRRRDLVETQRERRIPFLRGIAAVLHAEGNATTPAARTSLYSLAAPMLDRVGELLDGSGALDATLYGGLARARLGEFDAAETAFAQVATDSAASPSQIFAARMGGVINRTMRGGPPAGLAALDSIEPRYGDPAKVQSNLFYRILIVDHRFLLRHRLAMESPPEQRDQPLAAAYAAYIDWMNAERGAAGDAVRAIAMARLSNAAAKDADVPLQLLPAIVTVAVADQLSRAEATRRQAILMLEQALKTDQLGGADRAAALFVLGRALHEHGDDVLAAQRFIEMADRFPADHQSQRAIEIGVALAAERHRRTPDDPESRSLLREAWRVMLHRYPNLPTIDRWRYAAGRLALGEDRFDEALALFKQITPRAAEWIDAHFMQAATERARAAKAADMAERRQLSAQVIAALDRVRPVLEAAARDQADEARQAAIQTYLAAIDVYRAEALLSQNKAQEALTILDRITAASAIPPHVVGEALKVKLGAYEQLKKPEQAMGEIEEFARRSPQQAGDVLRSMVLSMRRDVEALIEQGQDDRALRAASSALLPAARLFRDWLDSHAGDRRADSDLRLVAASLRLSGQSLEALSVYDDLLRQRPGDGELLLGRAECLFAAGGEEKFAAAMEIYKRLAAAGPESNHSAYWQSQLRMLQILDRLARNTSQIAPQIERLRQRDRELGGERFRRGFELLRNKHAARST